MQANFPRGVHSCNFSASDIIIISITVLFSADYRSVCALVTLYCTVIFRWQQQRRRVRMVHLWKTAVINNWSSNWLHHFT